MDDRREGFQTILATSRTLHLEPAEAKAAVQACVESFTEVSSGAPGELRLNLPAGARAMLGIAPLRGASAGDRSLLVGSLRSRRGWVSVPVEIEVAPLSSSCSELVVRPVGPICLRSTAHRRLFDRCSHALANFFRIEVELAALSATVPARAAVRRSSPAPAPVSVPV
ncbi:MAG: hypothetical protein ACRDZ7_04175 [Acidimicrobiia bacterium]